MTLKQISLIAYKSKSNLNEHVRPSTVAVMNYSPHFNTAIQERYCKRSVKYPLSCYGVCANVNGNV